MSTNQMQRGLTEFARGIGAGFSRRDWMRSTLAGMLGVSASGWMSTLAADAAANPERRRACILLWMSGGPSQIDTLDPKPDHANGGGVQAIESSVPGIRISENLPKVAQQMQHVAIVRSMTTREGDHERGTYLMRTGYRPLGPLHYPTLGSLYSKELAEGRNLELPAFVSVAPNRIFATDSYSPGFLGPQYAPLIVGDPSRGEQPGSMGVQNLSLPAGLNVARHDDRLSILAELENDFESRRPGAAVKSHRSAYEAAVKMMRSSMIEAFRIDDEPAELRAKYGDSRFGEGCLLARRLVERGVPFVEVSLNSAGNNQQNLGWDTHQGNKDAVKALCGVLDPAWATLMEDLAARGLLETTTILWMGEFGRTPRINGNQGRDHFPTAWSTAIAGGGIRGGQVIGATSADGMLVADHPVDSRDLLATLCGALGISGDKQNMSNVGRPIRIVDPESKPITEAIAT